MTALASAGIESVVDRQGHLGLGALVGRSR